MSKRKRSRRRRAAAPAQASAGRAVAPAAPAPARPAKAARRKPQQAARPAAAPAGAEPFDRLSLLGAAAAGLIAFLVYALTVEPSVPTGDSGELIAAAYGLGIPHPPGYPLYMMLGHLATLLPGGSPALRMNLLSALFDAVAVGLVFLVVHRLVAARRDASAKRDWAPLAAASVGALLLAFSSLFWAYSVVAEVFALNNLFAAALLLVGLEWTRRPDRVRLLWLFMLLLGLALTNQQTIVLFVPAFLVLAWQGWTTVRQGGAARRPSVRDLGIAVVALVAGLLPYLYLPLAASTNPAVNWGDPTTFGRFVTDISRGNYGSTSLVVGGKKGSILENMSLLFGDLTWGLVFVGVVLALLGLWWSWRHRRLAGLALLTAFVVAGPAFQAYTDTAYPDRLTEGVIARFYILPTIPVAIAAGLGAWWVLLHAGRLRLPGLRPGLVTPAAAVALLCAPVASAVTHYGAQDQSENYVAYHYARDLLGNLPPNALLLMRSDENYTSVSYAQSVEHFRTDVIALDTELLKLPSYVAQARREHPSLLIPFSSYDGGVHTSLNSFVQANLSERPVYYVGVQEEKTFGKPFDHLNEGLSTRLVAKGTAPDAYAVLAQDPARYAALHYPSRLYPRTSWEAAIGRVYAYAAFDVGYAIQTDGTKAQVPLGEDMYRTAIRLLPTLAAAYKDLGLLLHDNGGDPTEIIALWQKFLQLKPNDPEAPAIRSALAALKGKH